MPRLLRWLVNGLCLLSLLSLLACGGAGWLWWHSYRDTGDRLTVRLRGEWYLLRSQRGRVVVAAAPRDAASRQGPLARYIALHRDGELTWPVKLAAAPSDWEWGLPYPERPAGPPLPPSPLPLRPALPAVGLFLRPLLEALDDPDRFALAHELLVAYTDVRPHGQDERRLDRSRRRVVIRDGGLIVEFPPDRADWSNHPTGVGWSEDPFAAGSLQPKYEGPGIHDPSQIPVLRDFWLDRFARPVGSAPYSVAVALAAAPLLLRLSARACRLYARRRRRRLGRCLSCGYDLTGNTSGRCSECGEPVPAERRVTA